MENILIYYNPRHIRHRAVSSTAYQDEALHCDLTYLTVEATAFRRESMMIKMQWVVVEKAKRLDETRGQASRC